MHKGAASCCRCCSSFQPSGKPCCPSPQTLTRSSACPARCPCCSGCCTPPEGVSAKPATSSGASPSPRCSQGGLCVKLFVQSCRTDVSALEALALPWCKTWVQRLHGTMGWHTEVYSTRNRTVLYFYLISCSEIQIVKLIRRCI